MNDSLPSRMNILKQTPLYKGGDLLIDIGCATGYFEVALANKYKTILAISPGEKEIEQAKENTKHLLNVSVHQSTFGRYEFASNKGDVVYLGNCMHYIFMEYRGFGFYDKLSDICTDYLIIEYPYNINSNASDMKALKSSLVSLKLDKLFTKNNILQLFNREFRLEQVLASGSPTREILVWKKR